MSGRRFDEAVAAHKDNPEAVSAILLHGWQQGYDMSEFYTGGQEPPAAPGPRSEIPSSAARFSEVAPQGGGGGGGGGGTRLAMADDPYALGRPRFEVGGGRGGGATGGRPVPVIEPEIMPPSRAVATQPAKLDWSEPLRQTGFPTAQLRAMSPQEIEAAGRKVVETRLGPMLKPLVELGYTQQQVLRMTPAEARRAIKGKIISAPGTPKGGWLGDLLKE